MRAERRDIPHEPDWDEAAGRVREESRNPHQVREQTPARVVAVFETKGQAERAAASVAAVAPSARVAVGTDDAHVASLRAEMAEESARSLAGPGVGLFTKEMARGASWGAAVWAAVAALVALPFAFIPFGTVSFGPRLIILAIVGAVAGATFGFVAGGGAGAKGPATPMDAEAGTTLTVEGASGEDAERAADVLAAAGPIRVDEFRDGNPEARRS